MILQDKRGVYCIKLGIQFTYLNGKNSLTHRLFIQHALLIMSTVYISRYGMVSIKVHNCLIFVLLLHSNQQHTVFLLTAYFSLWNKHCILIIFKMDDHNA